MPPFELSFATTQSQVSLYARAAIGSGDFSLVAFDRSGLRVAETTATVTDAGWTKLSVGLSVATGAIFYYMFVWWLNVPVPPGLLLEPLLG